MLETVYEGVPPEREAENAGVEDWGIEDISIKNSYVGIKPMILTPEKSLTKRIQIKQLIRSILQQKVSEEETSHFLDQFRYTIVTSNLLERQPVFKCYTKPVDLRRKDLLFDFQKPWVQLYTMPLCQLAKDGGVMALGLALHSKFTNSTTKAERSTVCAVIAFMILVFNYATRKRRLLRSLREKALAYMELFVTSSKELDGDCVRAIQDIQDTDVAVSGFTSLHSKPGMLAQQSNLLGTNFSASVSACKQLKAITSSSLLLIKEYLLNSLNEVIGMCRDLHSLEQFFEIYNVSEDLREFGVDVSLDSVAFAHDDVKMFVGANACYCSTKELKREFRKTLLLRRVFLCCLLTIKSSGISEVEELEKWTVVTDNLLEGTKLMQQLSKMLSIERFRPTAEDIKQEKGLAQEKHTQSHAPKSNGLLLAELTSSARLLSARMGVIYDSDAPPDLIEEHISAVSAGLDEINSKWLEFAGKRKQTDMKTYSSPTLIMTPESNKSDFEFDSEYPTAPELGSTSCPDSSYSYQTLSFEGESNNFPFKSQLSRAERIEKMKTERELANETAKMFNQRSSLVQELNSVIQERGIATNQF